MVGVIIVEEGRKSLLQLGGSIVVRKGLTAESLGISSLTTTPREGAKFRKRGTVVGRNRSSLHGDRGLALASSSIIHKLFEFTNSGTENKRRLRHGKVYVKTDQLENELLSRSPPAYTRLRVCGNRFFHIKKKRENDLPYLVLLARESC